MQQLNSIHKLLNIVDLSINNNDGTPINMAVNNIRSDTPGEAFTSSMFFNGLDEYVIIGDVLNFNLTDVFSFSIWFKTFVSSGTLIIISKTNASFPFNGYELFLDGTSGSIGFQLTNTVSTNHMRVDTTTTGFNDNQWHQVVVTWGGDGANIYIDGLPQELNIVVNTLVGTIITSSPLQFGARSRASMLWNGGLNDVAVYDKELSSSEVAVIYNVSVDLRSVGPIANLVGYWLMGNGVVLTDLGEVYKYYQMVGTDLGAPSQPNYHTWIVKGRPDPAGTLAVGNDAPQFGGPLINIAISAEWPY